MSLAKWALGLALVGLVACGKSSNSSSTPSAPPAEVNLEELSNDYTQIADLNVLHTGDNLENPKGNALSFKGKGKKSIYKAVYRFNSQNLTSFKLMSFSRAEQGSLCTIRDILLKLRGNGQETELIGLSTAVLSPSTEYTLEVAFKHSCNEMDMKFDVEAWVGYPHEEPQIGKVCEGQKIIQAAFLKATIPYEMYSSIVGARKFLASDTYCGKEFRGAVTKCSAQMENSTLNSQRRQDIENSGCTAEKENEFRFFAIEFNNIKKTAIIRCETNGNETFREEFANCRDVMLDANAVRRP